MPLLQTSISKPVFRSFVSLDNKNAAINKQIKETRTTYNKKSCSQHGVAPLTVTVVDFTFCSFKVT